MNAEQIRNIPSKSRPFPVETWVVAELSRFWQSMKQNIQHTIAADMQEQHRTAQSKPASSHNHS